MNSKEQQSTKIIRIFKNLLPNPLTIAILLTIFTLLIALFFTKPADTSHGTYFIHLVSSWESGLWDSSGGGLYFAFQMMLILVLGHILALTPLVNRFIQQLISYCKDTKSSVVVVALGSISLGLINWGLGLIFGAIITRKIGEKFAQEQKALNYGLVGAAAYATMMVWHGGLSGSATTKSMEEGHIPQMMEQAKIAGVYPSQVPFETTIGSTLNLTVTLLCLILIPLILYWIARKGKNEQIPHLDTPLILIDETENKEVVQGAERLDFSRIFGITLGSLFIVFGLYKAISYEGSSSLGFIQLNFINFLFLGLSLLLHQTINRFTEALQVAIGDVAGILIQFPLYFGILAIMQSSGMIILFSNFIAEIANEYTLPLYTFFNAGLVNFFVPSGGGQWAIQGPIVIETAQQLGGNIPKTILAMAYGDQWTNMLQPFWALPLLGITQLKPQQLLPYSFVVFIVGLVIFATCLLIF